MKKTAILLTILILISFSCNKKYRFYAFDIKESVTIEIPLDSSEDFETTVSIDLGIDKLLESKGTEAEMIEEISIEEVCLPSGDYTIFNDLVLFISTASTNETMLANNDSTDSVYDFNTGNYITKLAVSEDRMDDHVKVSKINIKTIAKLDTALIDDLYGDLPGDLFHFDITYNLRFRVQTYVK